MAIAHVGNLGTALSSANNQVNLTITTVAAAEAGNFVVVVVAVDNNQTTSGASTAVANVTSGTTPGTPDTNTWTRAIGQAAANGVNQDGADVSIWYSRLIQTVPNGGFIRATFTTNTTSDASAMSAREFTVGGAMEVNGTPAGLANLAADPGSLNVTTTNVECLRVRGIATETHTSTALTVTGGGWAAITQAISNTSGTVAEMAVRGEYLISTGTSAASDPTLFSADHASAYAAFSEVPVTLLVTGNAFLVM
jgi:hypothetical protein